MSHHLSSRQKCVCVRLCLCGTVIYCHVRSWDICHKRYSAVPLRSILNQKIVKCNCTFKRRHKNIENCHNFLFVKLQLSIFISCLPDWHICHGGCSFRHRIRTKSVSCSPVDMYTFSCLWLFLSVIHTELYASLPVWETRTCDPWPIAGVNPDDSQLTLISQLLSGTWPSTVWAQLYIQWEREREISYRPVFALIQ